MRGAGEQGRIRNALRDKPGAIEFGDGESSESDNHKQVRHGVSK